MTKDNDTTENFNATEAGEGGRFTGALRSYNPVRKCLLAVTWGEVTPHDSVVRRSDQVL